MRTVEDVASPMPNAMYSLRLTREVVFGKKNTLSSFHYSHLSTHHLEDFGFCLCRIGNTSALEVFQCVIEELFSP